MLNSIKYISREIFSVVIGVLIALFISNWKQQNDDKKFLDTVLESIEQEIESDHEDVTMVIEKQYALIDTIVHYIEDDQVSLTDCVIKTNGLKVYTAKGNSWWSFLTSKIEVIGYETIAALSEMEDNKQFINVKLDKLMDFFTEKADATSPSDKRMFAIQISNLLDTEEELKSLYAAYLEKE